MKLTNRKWLAVVLAVILSLALVFTMSGCGQRDDDDDGGKSSDKSSSGNAATVVKSFFDAIDNHDAKKFLKCFQDDVTDEFMEYMDEEDLEYYLEMLDELLEEEYGKNWRKKVKVGKAEMVDKQGGITYYDVAVTMDDEDEEYVTVIKEKGKFYISEDFMDSGF